MTLSAEDQEKFDRAQEIARQEYRSMMEKMTPEEKAGAEKLLKWFKGNYMTAGYKRLAAIMMNR